ncbi:hypothetical protein LMG33818_001269 [Halomonadaceae bacterium LMG 33818]
MARRGFTLSVKKRPQSSTSRKSRPVQTRKAKARQSQTKKAVNKSSPQARSNARASKRAVTQGKRQQALARSTERTQHEASERFSRTLQGTTKEGVAIVMLAICAFLLLALCSYSSADPGWSSSGPQAGVSNWMGQTGALISNYLLSFLGTSSLWIPALFGFMGWRLFSIDAAVLVWDPMRLGIRFVGLILTLTGSSVLFDLSPLSDYANLPSKAGGIVGQQMSQDIGNMFGHYGTVLAALVMLLCGMPLLFNRSWGNIAQAVGTAASQFALFLMVKAKWIRAKLDRKSQDSADDDISLEKDASAYSPEQSEDDILFQESEKRQGNRILAALRRVGEFFKRDSRRAPLLPYGEEHPDAYHDDSAHGVNSLHASGTQEYGGREYDRRPPSDYDSYPRGTEDPYSYHDDTRPHDIPWEEVDHMPSRRTRDDLREQDPYVQARYEDNTSYGDAFDSDRRKPSRYDDWPLRHIGEYQSNARHDAPDEEASDVYATPGASAYGDHGSHRYGDSVETRSRETSPPVSDAEPSEPHSAWPKHHAAYFSSRPPVTVDSLKAHDSRSTDRHEDNATLWGSPASSVSSESATGFQSGDNSASEVSHGHTSGLEKAATGHAAMGSARDTVRTTGNDAGNGSIPAEGSPSNVIQLNRFAKSGPQRPSVSSAVEPGSSSEATSAAARQDSGSSDHVPHSGEHLLPTDYAPTFDKELRASDAHEDTTRAHEDTARENSAGDDHAPTSADKVSREGLTNTSFDTRDSQSERERAWDTEGDVTRRRIPEAFSAHSSASDGSQTEASHPEAFRTDEGASPASDDAQSGNLPTNAGQSDITPDMGNASSAVGASPLPNKPRIRVGGNQSYPASTSENGSETSAERGYQSSVSSTAAHENTPRTPEAPWGTPNASHRNHQSQNEGDSVHDGQANTGTSQLASMERQGHNAEFQEHKEGEKGLFGNKPEEATDELAAVQPVAPETSAPPQRPVEQPPIASAQPPSPSSASVSETPVGGAAPLKVWTVDQLQNQGGNGDSIALEGEMPSTRLLTPADEAQPSYTQEELDEMGNLLETRLHEFGVKATVVKVSPGPVITRFEIEPAAGVKSSKISNLDKDLARSLLVKSVRVIEVIQGRSTVGIEIPNPKRAMIRLRQVLESPVYEDAKSPVTVALGQNISGQPVVADLGKMPHVLVAGTTGSGKSVGVNAMLISMLLKSTPEEVRMILIDPKMLELSVYDDIPHLLAPVVTDMKEAANSLRWCVAEMERRYKLMSKMGVRNIAGFNARLDEAHAAGAQIADPLWDPEPWQASQPHPMLEKLPYIVVVIDEFADMFMIVGKKVEELIARLAQKARAAGIHLVLATQRPSVDVVTGLIKANIPSRIAFQVSSKIDSRTILDQGGAESLLGHGDMLYLAGGAGTPVRVHGAFVDDDEVHRVVEDWRARGKPEYVEEILSGDVSADALTGLESEGDGNSDAEQDVLYDEAVAFVTKAQRVSVSSVQRNFKIGYNRASRLVEAMEKAGVVSSMGTNGAREVLVSAPPRD